MKRPILLPLVPLYAAAVALRSLGLRLGIEGVQKLAWPVISVGNLSAGGTGKTPLTVALARLLVSQGFAVDVLSRGYGRTGNSAEKVDPAGESDRFGDEPLLIAREAEIPVYVAARRGQAGHLAESEAARPGIHLLDDGFQHRQLHRDIDIVLINSDDLSDFLLPAGNLREPLSSLNRATVFAISAEDEEAVRKLNPLGKPIWRFRREMIVPKTSPPAVAFCGIARPEQFFAGIEAAGVSIAAKHAFPDHHRFTPGDIALLARLVQSTGAKALLTTAKDRIRLSALEAEIHQIAPLHSVGLHTSLLDETTVAAWITAQLKPRLLPSSRD
jgi:tetraacyldisaccharide 4'-kinase